jgi:hypothetical protein
VSCAEQEVLKGLPKLHRDENPPTPSRGNVRDFPRTLSPSCSFVLSPIIPNSFLVLTNLITILMLLKKMMSRYSSAFFIQNQAEARDQVNTYISTYKR